MLARPIHDCPLQPLHPLPRLTGDLPGCGGRIRSEVEDFEVEEIPLYEPCGSGDHLYLWIEKVDVAAETLRRHVSRALGISNMDVGMAGLKDRRAVTRQWISVPKRCGGQEAQALLDRIQTDRIRVLDAKLHRNKLRTAHLAGNRFRIRLRGTVAEAKPLAEAKLQLLQQRGLPNFFGAQRMGHGGSTLAAGWALSRGLDGLQRIRTPDDTVHTLNLADRPLRRLAASALQSEVFNRTLARRMESGTVDRVLDGDLCQKTTTGGTFPTDDPAREAARLLAGEIVITGPMWGPRMLRPEREALALELEVLAASGLEESAFAALGPLAEGTRRWLTVVPGEARVTEAEDGIVVTFSLPAGSFATGLIHELTGPSPLDGLEQEGETDVELPNSGAEEPSQGGPRAGGPSLVSREEAPCA